MILKKTIFVISFLAIFGLLFNFVLPNAKAMTNEEIQDLIDQLLQQVTELQQQLAETEDEGEEWCHNFNINLGHGSTGSEVEALQIALEKQNLYQGESSYFDEQVASAVTGFQEKYREDVLASWGLSHGTGYVGDTTRDKLNELYGCVEKDDDYSGDDGIDDDYSIGIEVNKNLPPVIDGLEAPSQLRVDRTGTCQQKVREEGSWTIRAHDPENGSLAYSVNWGDGRKNEQQAAKTATFSHSYSGLGTYTIKFVVIDNEQQETEVSIIVKVVSEVDNSYSFWSQKNSLVDSTDEEIGPGNVILSGEWEEMINNLKKEFPDADDYIGKIEYYLKDAIADQFNSTDGKMAEDTTAYRGALRMMDVLQSFNNVEAAGYEGGFGDFCSSCSFGYSHLRRDIYKIVDGVPTIAAGDRVYDRTTQTWYVWDEWTESARVASDTEVRIFDMIDNQVTDVGDEELNMIHTKEGRIKNLDELIEKYEDRIEITLSGGRVSDTWGDLEYLRDHIEQWKKDIANYGIEIDGLEEDLADVLGIDLGEWRDNDSDVSSEDYTPPISDRDEYYNSLDDDDNDYPDTPGDYWWNSPTANDNLDEKIKFTQKKWFNRIKEFPWLDDVLDMEIIEDLNYDDVSDIPPWLADVLEMEIEDLNYNDLSNMPGYYNPSISPGDYDSGYDSDDNGDDYYTPPISDRDEYYNSLDDDNNSNDDDSNDNNSNDDPFDSIDDSYWEYTKNIDYDSVEKNLASISEIVSRLTDKIKELFEQ